MVIRPVLLFRVPALISFWSVSATSELDWASITSWKKVSDALLHLVHDIILSHPADVHWYKQKDTLTLAHTHKTHIRTGTAINTGQRLFNATGEHLDTLIYTTEPIWHSTGYMIACASVQRVMLTHHPITLRHNSQSKISRCSLTWYGINKYILPVALPADSLM